MKEDDPLNPITEKFKVNIARFYFEETGDNPSEYNDEQFYKLFGIDKKFYSECIKKEVDVNEYLHLRSKRRI